jgi:acyl carrier protein
MLVEKIIREYIASNILFSNNGYPYTDDTSFLDEGIVDSTSVLELIMLVEEKFGIVVEDQEITPDNFDSISNIANYVRGKEAVTP